MVGVWGRAKGGKGLEEDDIVPGVGREAAAVAVIREAVSADMRAPCKNEMIVCCPSSKTLGIMIATVTKKMASPMDLNSGIKRE